MMARTLRVLAGLFFATIGVLAADTNVVSDPRHISNGRNIPSEGYADQPYIVKTDDGAWLCVITTGKGREGARGQHIISMRSTDQGRTWTNIVSVEPADGPEASYAVLFKVPGGRTYAFYNHNTDRIIDVKREDGGTYKRVDSLGHYVFKFTDDHGLTWSSNRYEVPVREFECDRDNVYGGKIRFFWNVGRPLILRDEAILVLHKVGAMGFGFFAESEGAFLKSKNLLIERDPEKIIFETLPDGDVGLRTPEGGGRIAEEQSVVALSDGSLYCTYRTVDGWPASAYSHDSGHTWTKPAYASYTPGGRRIKHPRAANFVWRCSNGKFLYWFHNHGGPIMRKMGDLSKYGNPYDDRNPGWLAAGREIDTPQGKCIEWSQPEILVYDDDPFVRISYPDLIEDGGKFYFTETQKNIARLHEISGKIPDGLFNQWTRKTVVTNGLVLDLSAVKRMPAETNMPKIPVFHVRDNSRPDYGGKDLRLGFTLDFWLKIPLFGSGLVLLDNRDEHGRGTWAELTEEGTVRLAMSDGRTQSSWDCDRGRLKRGKLHHVVAVVDGGPKIISFILDGILCDGGDERQFGWGRFSPHLQSPRGSPTLKISNRIRGLRVYERALRTSEAVANFNAGLPQ